MTMTRLMTKIPWYHHLLLKNNRNKKKKCILYLVTCSLGAIYLRKNKIQYMITICELNSGYL